MTERAQGSIRLDEALQALVEHEVQFIVVGGVAAVLQGAPIVTIDLDIVHARDASNVARLKTALDSLGAIYRHQHGRRIPARASVLAGPGHNLMQTSVGPIDALGSLDGRSHDDFLDDTVVVDFDGAPVRVLKLAALIALKKAAGRPKDWRVMAELEATLARIRATADGDG